MINFIRSWISGIIEECNQYEREDEAARQRLAHIAGDPVHPLNPYSIGVDPAAPDGDHTALSLIENGKVIASAVDGDITKMATLDGFDKYIHNPLFPTKEIEVIAQPVDDPKLLEDNHNDGA